MAITRANFILIYEQFASVDVNLLAHAIKVANAIDPDGVYSDATRSDHRRYLEVAAILFDHPKGRALLPAYARVKTNPYRAEALFLDRCCAYYRVEP